MAFCGCVCRGEEAPSVDVRSSLYDHQFWSSKCIFDWGSTFHNSSLLKCWNFPVSQGFLLHLLLLFKWQKAEWFPALWDSDAMPWGQWEQNLEHSSCLPYRAKSYLLSRAGQVRGMRKPHPHTLPCRLLALLMVLLLLVGLMCVNTYNSAKTGANSLPSAGRWKWGVLRRLAGLQLA